VLGVVMADWKQAFHYDPDQPTRCVGGPSIKCNTFSNRVRWTCWVTLFVLFVVFVAAGRSQREGRFSEVGPRAILIEYAFFTGICALLLGLSFVLVSERPVSAHGCDAARG
jgi:hypothetical protein